MDVSSPYLFITSKSVGLLNFLIGYLVHISETEKIVKHLHNYIGVSYHYYIPGDMSVGVLWVDFFSIMAYIHDIMVYTVLIYREENPADTICMWGVGK